MDSTAPSQQSLPPREVPASVAAPPVPPGAEVDHPSLYFNRELGALDFNWRVLSYARDERLPILERLRFLAITAANLDEFFQKFVGALKRTEAPGVLPMTRDGRATETMQVIRDAATALGSSTSQLWEHEFRPRLRAEAEIVVSSYEELAPSQRSALDEHFRRHVYPILTPLAVDPGHPFPLISNLSLSLAVLMRHPSGAAEHFARVKVPTAAGRWLAVPDAKARHHVVPIEQVVLHNARDLFRGMQVLSVHAFRITRSVDVRRDEHEAEDLVSRVAEELRERRFAPVVRLEVEREMPAHVRELLIRELELSADDVFEVDGLLALSDAAALADLDVPGGHFPAWEPVVPRRFQRPIEAGSESIFDVIRRGDALVHHPYESFSATVQRLVEEAADDPDVVAIKQTLYRTSEDSPIVRALMRAAERDKQVAVLVELKARFDERRNLEWAEALEDAGVHVNYGLLGLKTHAKAVLVVRYEDGAPRTYCHLGTGNYHARTARAYTDLGLLTCDAEIGRDVVNFFHALTGHAPDQRYEQLVVAPRDMRGALEALIDAEVERARDGRGGRIVAKMNALDDPPLIAQLYRASQAGVRIDLLVRGHCRLRPGLPGYSENVRVVSIVGRFLEHERVYVFGHGGDARVLIGSADWRQRNLNARVEALVPIRSAHLRDRIERDLRWALEDNCLAWDLHPDGTYVRRVPAPGEPRRDLHQRLLEDAQERASGPDGPRLLHPG